MKCPSCLSIMSCRSAINPVPNQPGKNRMDLHCWNKNCIARCHMGVITEDPREWICHDYSFSLKYEDSLYYLRGYDFLVDSRHQNREYSRKTMLYNNFDGLNPLISTDFIPLSTGDDMHEKAWELFHKLRKLVVFS